MDSRQSFNLHELARILRLLNDREFYLGRAAEIEQLALALRSQLDPKTRRTLDRLILTDSKRLDRNRASSRKAVSRN